MKKKDLPKVSPVHIKPLFGMKPGLWLTILYSIVLVLAIFLICFLPGLVRGGKRVSFTSAASNSAVYIDGTYQGGTPFTRFVPSGSHTVEFKVNEVLLDSKEIKVGHPVFMTWMFPRKMKVTSDATLNETAYKALLKEFFTDLGTYSAILEYDDTYRYAPIFSDFVKAVYNSSFASDLKKILDDAAYFVTTEEMQTDYRNACALCKVSPVEMSLDPSSFSLRDKGNYSSDLSFTSSVLDAGSFTVNGFDTGKYSIAQICVTENMWAHFVNENPQWALTNKEALIEEGLVDDWYLSGVSLSLSVTTNRPVRNISYKAAQAFCSWLSSKTEKTVTLPSETQWTECCLSCPDTGMQRSSTPALIETLPSAMLGCVWELTSTSYIPHSSLDSDSVHSRLANYGAELECVIKGGSYVSPSEISATDVGTAALNLCSDYMGFRIIWY